MIPILVVGFILRLIDLNQSLNLAEAQFLLNASPGPFTLFPPEGPLYYSVLHYWLKLALTQEWFLRLPSLIFGLLTIYFFAQTVKLFDPKKIKFQILNKIYNLDLSLILALFLALNPLHVHFSTQVNPLSLILLLTTASWSSLLKYLKKKNTTSSLFFWFFTLLNLLTHVGTIFNLILQLIYLVVYHRKFHPKFLIYSLLAIILFSANVFALIVPKVEQDWRTAFGYLQMQAEVEDPVIVFAYSKPFSTALWYAAELNFLNPLGELNKDPILFDLAMSQGTVGKKDIYYFRYLEDLTDPNRNITLWLSNAGFTLIDSVKFAGLGYVDHYSVISK